ncbi:hypothetical protein [Hyalangium rubrum]|uniref:Protein kinase domain-containing protein n=1 Tax=Hyalangium rubrum TaxID=3103134 RepID=A0ABU5HGW1_9BACT|nr:hypothetical protein [Hyalangium sp. s54d21]MDY7232703.1 hypothetical protein [Hyalangium sp. s54d21]
MDKPRVPNCIRHPPTTNPGNAGSRLWYADRASPRTPWVLNARVDPQLSALILRMLSLRPKARGTAQELARLLEQEAECAGPTADQPLFAGLVPAVPKVGKVHEARQQASEDKAQAARREAAELARVMAASAPREQGLMWLPWIGVGIATVLLAVISQQHSQEPSSEEAPVVAQAESRDGGMGDGGTIELAQEVLTAPMKEPSPPRGWSSIGLDVPPNPLPGQRRPDSAGKCRQGEVVINGGCWRRFAEVQPPCNDDEYEWRDACYYPAYDSIRQPTSEPPAPRQGAH